MATTVTKSIRSSGGDYTTLTAWDAVIPANLVTEDEQWVAECYNDWSSGLSDTLVIEGHTTDTTRNIVIKPSVSSGEEGASEHDGTPDSGFKLTTPTNQRPMDIRDAYVVVEGIQVQSVSTYGDRACIWLNGSAGANFTTIKNCILTHDGGAYSTVAGISADYSHANSTISVYNNVVLTPHGISSGYKGRLAVSGVVANNTFSGCTKGFHTATTGDSTSNSIKFHNNIFYNCTTDVDANLSWDTESHNATSKASGLDGTNNVYNISSSDFTDSVNDDYSVASDSALIDAGTDLSTEFTTDIVGTERG